MLTKYMSVGSGMLYSHLYPMYLNIKWEIYQPSTKLRLQETQNSC